MPAQTPENAALARLWLCHHADGLSYTAYWGADTTIGTEQPELGQHRVSRKWSADAGHAPDYSRTGSRIQTRLGQTEGPGTGDHGSSTIARDVRSTATATRASSGTLRHTVLSQADRSSPSASSLRLKAKEPRRRDRASTISRTADKQSKGLWKDWLKAKGCFN